MIQKETETWLVRNLTIAGIRAERNEKIWRKSLRSFNALTCKEAYTDLSSKGIKWITVKTLDLITE